MARRIRFGEVVAAVSASTGDMVFATASDQTTTPRRYKEETYRYSWQDEAED